MGSACRVPGASVGFRVCIVQGFGVRGSGFARRAQVSGFALRVHGFRCRVRN
ncbi:hypothetical protein T484DRAFT_1924145 [Baffinella frigidus]|nr:hypothetical protein T484DRAFT_1924145 [Cryptophyta sp. CCMP2293]